MKRLFVFFLALVFAASVRADDQLRAVQQALKDQGFYYGEVDGEEGTETNAAIRRYQIRNGLDVSGKLNAQTLASLGFGEKKPAQPQPPAAPPTLAEDNQNSVQAVQPPPPQQPQRPAPRQPNVVESDKNFLRQQPPATPAAPTTPPAEEATISPKPQADLAQLFQRTPYERAPLEVQRNALKRAQAQLSREGFYRGDIDGIPGPETARGIAEYQRDAGLPPTGQLDMRTLAEMNLLPPTRRVVVPAPARPPFDFDDEPPVIQRRVYRGIWVR